MCIILSALLASSVITGELGCDTIGHWLLSDKIQPV
jgi:hypothetical protein